MSIIYKNHNIKSLWHDDAMVKRIYYEDMIVYSRETDSDQKYDREVASLVADSSETYIITDILFKDLTKYDFEIKGWCGLGATMLFGARNNSANVQSVAMIHSKNGQYQFRIYDGTNVALTLNDTLPHVFTWNGAAKEYRGDGSKFSGTIAPTYAPKVDTSMGLALFGCNTNGTVDNCTLTREIFYFKLWYEGELIADYIPVIDNNGIACFYDKVNDKFWRSSGTGKFKYTEEGIDTYQI